MKNFIVSRYQKIKDFYFKYERVLMSASLVGGFLFDFIAFVNIDVPLKLTILLVYWFLSGVCIAFMQLYDLPAGRQARVFTYPIFKYLRIAVPLALQFMFGGLLNISLIFYWFSGAFSVSWPFIAIMVLLLLFNDSFRQHFSKPLVQIGVYFFITFSVFSLVLPFWFASLSPWLFVAAGVASTVFMLAYIYGLSVFVGRTHAQNRPLWICVIAIALVMNVLYFANIIPPIPLALREAGLYHSLSVSGSKYTMQGEPENFLQNIEDGIFGQNVHVVAGEKMYLYTAIFAPENLDTTIVHRWQYYDPLQKKWIEKGKLSFVIYGGQKEGYKGYSWQSNLAAGKWRVSVENVRGQVLARVRFNVTKVNEMVILQEVRR